MSFAYYLFMDRFAKISVMAACVLLLSACEDAQSKVDNALPDVKLGADGEAVKAQVKEDGRYIADETKANAKSIGGNIERAGSRVADNVRDQVKKTNRKVRDWWLTPLPPEPEPRVVASSYCYRVMQDIICYREPMPGWEQRLVAYQGTHAEPPPPVVTRPLPMLTTNARESAQARLMNAKPVFVQLPAEEQKKKQSATDDVPEDVSQEKLPNPMLVPQL